jgi:hypothetical protein
LQSCAGPQPTVADVNPGMPWQCRQLEVSEKPLDLVWQHQYPYFSTAANTSSLPVNSLLLYRSHSNNLTSNPYLYTDANFSMKLSSMLERSRLVNMNFPPVFRF